MPGEHYFSSEPASEFKPKDIKVTLDGSSYTVFTASGIFSPERLDAGTEVLLEHLDEVPKSGNLLDIGCGWGPIAISLALRAPKATVWAIDVNQRSLELTRMNCERLGIKNVKACTPDEVPEDLQFSGIWSNPPIRIGKPELHALLLRWLPRLKDGSESYLVVQKNLGADSLHRWLEAELPKGFSTIRVGTAKAYRVLRVKNRA